MSIEERVAIMQAHRAIRGVEHDVVTGKFHGDCLVCGVPFPCEYVGPPVKAPDPSHEQKAGDWHRTARISAICLTILVLAWIFHSDAPRLAMALAEAVRPQFNAYIDTSGFSHDHPKGNRNTLGIP